MNVAARRRYIQDGKPQHCLDIKIRKYIAAISSPRHFMKCTERSIMGLSMSILALQVVSSMRLKGFVGSPHLNERNVIRNTEEEINKDSHEILIPIQLVDDQGVRGQKLMVSPLNNIQFENTLADWEVMNEWQKAMEQEVELVNDILYDESGRKL